MTMFPTPALAPLDAEVRRLSRPRAWAAVQATWADEPELTCRTLAELLLRLRGSGEVTDPPALRLVARAAQGDGAALTVLLATLAGVFVVVARRRGGDVDALVSDQLSLAAEVVTSSPPAGGHVLAVLVSRVHSRHRRLRHRSRLVADGGDTLSRLAAPDDPVRLAMARVELSELAGAVRRNIRAGAFTADDWRRLVELRVHERTSAELAAAESMTAVAVRKRAQRTAACLQAVVEDAA